MTLGPGGGSLRGLLRSRDPIKFRSPGTAMVGA